MRKKLTKLMAVALALVMVAALLPAAAFAVSATTAADLAKAIAPDSSGSYDNQKVRVEGNEVTLLTNIQSVTSDVFINGGEGAEELTLNLSTFTLTLGGQSPVNNEIFVNNGAKLKITGTSGTITSEGQYPTISVSGSQLTVEKGVTVSLTYSGDVAATAIGVPSSSSMSTVGGEVININGATVTGPRAIDLNAPNATLTVAKESTITGTSLNGILAANNSKVIVNGGEIKGVPFGVHVGGYDQETKKTSPAQLTVNDGSIKSENNQNKDGGGVFVYHDSTAVISGGSVEGYSGVRAWDGATVTIEKDAKISGQEIGVDVYGFPEEGGTDHPAVVNISGGEVNGRYGAIAYGGGQLNISDGKISGTAAGIGTNGSDKDENTKITVTGGDISGSLAGAYMPAGKLEVSGEKTKISGQAGIVVRGGDVSVTGGTVEATSTTNVTIGDAKGTDGNRYTVPAAGITVDNAGYPAQAGGQKHVTVSGDAEVKAPTGGKTVVAANSGTAVQPDGDDTKVKPENNPFDIQGGKFTVNNQADKDNVTNYLPQGYEYTAQETIKAKEGTKFVAERNGIKYATLEEAILSATAGETVKLLDNVTLPGDADGTKRIEVKNKITLDLNGKTLTKSTNLKEEYAGLKVGTNGDLTITDTASAKGKITGNGTLIGAFDTGKITLDGCKIEQTEGKDTKNNCAVDTDGTGAAEITVKAGTVINAVESGVGAHGKATVNIEGGTIDADIYGVVTNGSNDSMETTVNITGGNITGGKAGMYLPSQKGVTNVSGDAVITGEDGAGVVVRGGTITVSEDEKGNAPTIVAGSNKAQTYGDAADVVPAGALVLDTKGYGSNNKKATLEAGEFKAPEGTDAVVLTNGDQALTTGDALDVQGGYYSKEVNKNFLADNVNTEAQTTDGEYGYFSSAVNVDEQMEQDGKTLKENTISILEGKAAFVAAGFIGTGTSQEDANKIINDAIKKTFPDATKKIEDSGENVFWAIFQATEAGSYKVEFSMGEKKYEETVTIAEGNKGGIVYFTPGMGTFTDKENFQGKYTVTLTKDSEQSSVSSATIEVYKVSYTADTKTVSGSHAPVFTDWDGLDAALKAQPDGFEFANGTSMWKENVFTPEKASDEYTYKVTLSAYTYVAPPMPGTDPDNPDNPDNPPAVDPAKQFVDVPDVAANKWYRDALNYVLTTKPGVIEGTDGTHFSPNAKLTRAAFAKILWALDGKETATAANPFTDVKAGAWYYDAVIWANAEGIMLGDAGRCKPEDNITREEMAVMIQRWLNKDGKAAAASKFTDAKDIHDWAAGAVNWAAEQGYIKGKDDGSFAPLASLTRAEMIVVVARTLGWIG